MAQTRKSTKIDIETTCEMREQYKDRYEEAQTQIQNNMKRLLIALSAKQIRRSGTVRKFINERVKAQQPSSEQTSKNGSESVHGRKRTTLAKKTVDFDNQNVRKHLSYV